MDPINTGIIEDGIGVRKETAPDDNCLNDKICQYLTVVDPYLMFIQFDEVDGAGTTGTMEVRDIASIVLYALGLPDKQPATWTSRVPAKLFIDVNTSLRPVYSGE